MQPVGCRQSQELALVQRVVFEPARLPQTFQALANPIRVQMLERLRTPCTSGALADAFGVSRQAIIKHLEVLQSEGFVHALGGASVLRPAKRFVANPMVLHAFKETVWALGGFSPALKLPPIPTVRTSTALTGPGPEPGLLVVHGDAPGRWYPLDEDTTVGRDEACGVVVPNDVFASGAHARVEAKGQNWFVRDLDSTNGTFLDFLRLLPGKSMALRPGQVVTVGRTHFVFRQ